MNSLEPGSHMLAKKTAYLFDTDLNPQEKFKNGEVVTNLFGFCVNAYKTPVNFLWSIFFNLTLIRVVSAKTGGVLIKQQNSCTNRCSKI